MMTISPVAKKWTGIFLGLRFLDWYVFIYPSEAFLALLAFRQL